jgi:1-acyl-sn-glycerol-3-phosphate acyltransferase
VNWVTRTLAALWGLFAWLSFALAVLLSLVVVLLVPSADMRQKLVTRAARLVFVLPRCEVKVLGLDNLPTGNCVVVANHASYVDGPLLKAYLPWRFNFVIKGELRDFPPAHFLLARSGSKFVERTDIQGSTRDARQLVKAALRGESLGFFPEGTFREEPGVGRFRAGAFVAAMKSDMPVIPIAIHGSRAFLPHGAFLPRRHPMTIEILPAIGPGDSAYSNSRTLAEESRQRILAVLDEPDLLAHEDAPE